MAQTTRMSRHSNSAASTASSSMPRLVEKDGRYALMVDGTPYLMLGGQINNSSAWPGLLPKVWEAAANLHVNTIEAPIYWEQLEPQPDHFDYSMVDMLVHQAREHHVHLVLLWFATWKNGSQHYSPEWVKLDMARFPREISPKGEAMDILSPHSDNNLHADIHAFTALMRHLKMIDGAEHTVLLIQVENEPGTYGTNRDYSPAAQQLFNGPAPAALVTAMHKSPGTWQQVFGADADESFAAWSISHYIDQVAAAGKAEYPLPMYVNVALRDPDDPHARAGANYPSGGGSYNMLDVWKATAHNVDIVAPDIYLSGDAKYRKLLALYGRPDNALFVPETANGPNAARYFFSVLGAGGIGFSPFGIDRTRPFIPPTAPVTVPGVPVGFVDPTVPPPVNPLAAEYELFAPMVREIARLNFDGKLQTAVEEKGTPVETLDFGHWHARVSYGLNPFGWSNNPAPGNAEPIGRVLVAQLGPNEYLVTGFHARIDFETAGRHREFLRVEEGHYEDGKWQFLRIYNGDQTDYGLNFTDEPRVLRVTLHEY